MAFNCDKDWILWGFGANSRTDTTQAHNLHHECFQTLMTRQTFRADPTAPVCSRPASDCFSNAMKDARHPDLCPHCLPDCSTVTYTYMVFSRVLRSRKICRASNGPFDNPGNFFLLPFVDSLMEIDFERSADGKLIVPDLTTRVLCEKTLWSRVAYVTIIVDPNMASQVTRTTRLTFVEMVADFGNERKK